MNRNKVKLFVIASVIGIMAVVLNISPQFASKAEGDDVLRAIAGYKNWTKLTEKPLRIKVNNIRLDGG